MADYFLGLKTDQSLLTKLGEASNRKPSHEEIQEQRVSYVFGFVKPSSGVTREQVRNVIVGHEGVASEAAK